MSDYASVDSNIDKVEEKQNKGIQLDKQDLIDWHKSLHKRGWAGYNWPKEYGGTGWSHTEIYIFQEACQFSNVQKHVCPILSLYFTTTRSNNNILNNDNLIINNLNNNNIVINNNK